MRLQRRNSTANYTKNLSVYRNLLDKSRTAVTATQTTTKERDRWVEFSFSRRVRDSKKSGRQFYILRRVSGDRKGFRLASRKRIRPTRERGRRFPFVETFRLLNAIYLFVRADIVPGRQRTNAFPNLYVHKEASGDFGVNGPTEAADKLAGSGRNTIAEWTIRLSSVWPAAPI